MDVDGSNERDSASKMGTVGKQPNVGAKPGRVNHMGKGSAVPSFTTYEDYDVFSGGKGLSQEEYMQATFHTSSMTDGDARFKKSAELMGDTASSLISESKRLRSAEDVGEEDDLDEQEEEAAL